ncbi:MAG: YlbF family regulator [Ammonifex sp.]|nr:MAG: YlbF family regulator [Ammonifex sp.]
MTVLVKAWELGAAISESQELKDVRTAEEAMFKDTDSRSLIEEFEQFRQELESMARQGVKPTSEKQNLFNEVRVRMNANALICDFMEAQERFNKILYQVNQILNQAITGSTGCNVEGCASCGGGCEE